MVRSNDLFAGARLTLNDAQDTALLAGGFYDYKTGSCSLRAEFERRLGQHFFLELEGQWFARSDRRDFVHPLRNDSFLQIALRRYF